MSQALARRPRVDVRPSWDISLARSSEMQRKLEPYVGQEIAGLELDAPFLPSRLGGVFQEIPHPSKILRERSELGQRVGELHETMLDDTDLAGLVGKRIDSVVALPRDIPDPVNEDRRAFQAVDLCRHATAKTELWQEALKQMLLSPAATGITFSELLWERLPRGPIAGAWVPVDVLDRKMHRFAWERGTKRLHVRPVPGKGIVQPVPVPPMKILALRSGSRDTPWGSPLLDKAYWLWYVKKHVNRYYAVWLERWAFPLATVKYQHSHDDKTNQKEINEALNLIASIQTDQMIAIPNKLALELLESKRNGSVTYEPYFEGVRAAWARLFLGEVDTGGMGEQPGSFAKSKVSNEVRREKTAGDAHLLEAYLTETLMRWIVEVNLGPDVTVPRYRIHAEDADDRHDRREGIAAALEAGQPVPRAHAYMTWQVPIPREGEDVIEPPAPPPAAPGVGGLFPFAAGPGPESNPNNPRPIRQAHLAADDPDAAAAQAHAEEQSADLEDLVERLHPISLDYYAAHRRAVEAAWDAGAAPRGDLARDVVRRMGQLPRAHARALQTAGLHAAGLALLHVRQDVERATQLAAPSDYVRSDTPEAAIEYWARLLGVPKEAFTDLDDLLRRYSFTVAGVQEAALLADIQQLTEEAIATGLDRESFVGRLAQLYEDQGVTPTSDWHARLVFDNNARQAHGAARYRQIVENPAGRRLVPYLRWTNLDTVRVRQRPGANHAVMGDRIFATDHPIWTTWWYPAGHGCRCWVGLINLAEARRMGLTGSEPTGPWPTDPHRGGRAMPDDGFRAAPRDAFGAGLATQVAKAERLESEASDAGATDLLGALELLWSLLGILGRIGGQ